MIYLGPSQDIEILSNNLIEEGYDQDLHDESLADKARTVTPSGLQQYRPIPLEVALSDISFTKGCYIGQRLLQEWMQEKL